MMLRDFSEAFSVSESPGRSMGSSCGAAGEAGLLHARQELQPPTVGSAMHKHVTIALIRMSAT